MRLALKTYSSMGMTHMKPFSFALLADAYADPGKVETGLNLLAEAQAIVEETGERSWEPELHRLRGEIDLRLWRARPTEDELGNKAEECF